MNLLFLLIGGALALGLLPRLTARRLNGALLLLALGVTTLYFLSSSGR